MLFRSGGLLLKKETQFFNNFFNNVEHPFVAVIGGAKVSSKIGILSQLIKKVDTLLIGGAMAYTFLKAQGYLVGKSLVEDDKLTIAKTLLQTAAELRVKVILPIDTVVCEDIELKENITIVSSDNICATQMGVDIGPKTIERFISEINLAKTIFCNGPLGIFDKDEFSNGTKKVLKAIAESDAFSVVGGGDSILALQKLNLMKDIDFVSTGGGASLEYLEGKKLPGIKVLDC